MNKLLTFLSLFGSLSTLLCCALPVTLVSLGMGATFASLTANVPQIIWLTERKDLLFLFTGLLLIISYLLMRQSEKMACPIDVNQNQVCDSSKKISKKMYWVTVFIYLIGVTFSYIIPMIIF